MTSSISSSPTRNRRLWRVMGAASVLALTALVTGPTAAQIGDAPPLGFTIDPTEGMVGSTVAGQVDVDDIAEHCITDPVAFVSQFVDPESPNTLDTPYISAVMEFAGTFEEGEMLPAQRLAALTALFFPLMLAQDLNSPESEGLAEQAMAGTFIMGFADLASQSPITPYGNFDKNTGVGSTEVPDLPGGNHPVIATCVGLPDEIDPASVAAALETTAVYVDGNVDLEDPEFDFIDAISELAPVLVEALIEPKALGIAFYCVDDGEGSCDEEEPTETTAPADPTVPTDPTVPADPTIPADPTDPPANGDGTAPGATPVPGRPSYTG